MIKQLSFAATLSVIVVSLSGCSSFASHEKADKEFAAFCKTIDSESTTWNRKDAAVGFTRPPDDDFEKYWGETVSNTTSYYLDITSGYFQDADPSDPPYAKFLKDCKSVGVEVSPAIRFF